jgi:DNA modification methylase
VAREERKALNKLFYGDNLDILRKKIKDETVDLCYIDPPFNSKRNYNQIYNNVGGEDQAQAQAFIDMWVWDYLANAGYTEIIANSEGRFQSQTVELIKGLRAVLGEGSLLAYLVSLTLRITEVFRVLKTTGSFYLHCDPTASHYIKVIVDSIFCSQGGDYKNEIIWKRAETVKGNFGQGSKRFDPNTDTIFFYSKSSRNTFNPLFSRYDDKINEFYKHVEPNTNRRYQLISMTAPGDAAKGNPYYEVMGVKRFWRFSKEKMQELIDAGMVVQTSPGNVPRKKQYLDEGKGVPIQSLWADLPALHSQSKERLGYPTQKPESLLERILTASSNENDVVLDAYCGCGTTVVVAQRMKRQWVGIDITYQSVSLMLRRLEDAFGPSVLENVKTDGIPRDMASAQALAHKKDDRLRKEFEKWAVLTYSNNRAIINEKKGADAGIDAVAYFLTSKTENAKVIFQVKSGNVKRGDIATLRGDMGRENAVMAVLITLEEPSRPMVSEAKAAGQYTHEMMGRNYDRISIVTVKEIVDEGKRLEIPMSLEVVKAAQKAANPDEQMNLL